MGGNEHTGIMILVIAQKPRRAMNLERARDYLSDGAKKEGGCRAADAK